MKRERRKMGRRRGGDRKVSTKCGTRAHIHVILTRTIEDVIVTGGKDIHRQTAAEQTADGTKTTVSSVQQSPLHESIGRYRRERAFKQKQTNETKALHGHNHVKNALGLTHKN